MIKKSQAFIWLFFFGSLWGLSEVFLGQLFHSVGDVSKSSSAVILSSIGFFILALARGIFPKAGSSTVIALIASLYRLANAVFVCHFVAVLLLGVAFDVLATVLKSSDKKWDWRVFSWGLAGPYFSHILFGLVMALVRYQYWTGLAGFQKTVHHIVFTGSLLAVATAGLVPVGYFLGLRLRQRSTHQDFRLAYGSLVFGLIFWVFTLATSTNF